MNIQQRPYSANEFADAQDRITTLEAEVERLRQEIQTLNAAGLSLSAAYPSALDKEAVSRVRRGLEDNWYRQNSARIIELEHKLSAARKAGEHMESNRDKCVATLEAEIARLNKVIRAWTDTYGHAVIDHRRELAAYRLIITKLGRRLGCMRKRRKREFVYYQKLLSKHPACVEVERLTGWLQDIECHALLHSSSGDKGCLKLAMVIRQKAAEALEGIAAPEGTQDDKPDSP